MRKFLLYKILDPGFIHPKYAGLDFLGTTEGVPLTANFQIFSTPQVHPISQSLKNALELNEGFSRGIFSRLHETFLENQSKKAWSAISLSYLSFSAYFIKSVGPSIAEMIMKGEMSAALVGSLVSAFFIFNQIPLVCNNLISNMVELFKPNQAAPQPMAENELPFVTVTIPTYNEPKEVLIETSIKSALALDYPKSKLEIVVISNSDTGKYEELQKYCEERGVVFIHRDGREGGKARNLNISLGLKPLDSQNYYSPKGNLFFQIDSDVSFPPDILKKSVPEFRDNEKLPYAVFEVEDKSQDNAFNALIGIANETRSKHASLMDQIGFTTSDGYGILYQKSAFSEVGGWKEDFVGEDLVTGMVLRSQSPNWTKGKRITYAKVIDRSPEDLARLAVQQKRWAKGTAEAVRKILPGFIHAKHIPWNEKADMFYRLTGYPAFSYSFLLAPSMITAAGLWGLLTGADFSGLLKMKDGIMFFTYSFLGVVASDTITSIKQKRFSLAYKNLLLGVPAALSFIGSVPFILKGLVEGYQNKSKTFFVTPKGGLKIQNPFIQIIKKYYPMFLMSGFLSLMGLVMVPLQAVFYFSAAAFLVAPLLSLIRLRK